MLCGSSSVLPVASILGAPVSGFMLDHAHWLAISSWRWLLILEGLPAIVCGVLTYFLLPSRPAEATFLTQDEKSWITAELAREEQENNWPRLVRLPTLFGITWSDCQIIFGNIQPLNLTR